MEEPTVRQLVELARAGDQLAWSRLVARFSGLVYSVPRRQGLEPAAAADVSQTTWLRLAENLDRIRDPDRLAGWLATTARNEAMRVLTRQGREVAVEFDEERVTVGDAVAEPVLADEQARILWGAVRQLSRRCQLLLRLLFADTELSYEEISDTLGMPHGSIGPTRARCLAQARALVGADYA